MLRCSEQILDQLIVSGLPCADRGGTQRFDRYDLFNLGLYSNSGRSLPELAISFLSRVAAEDSAAWTDRRGWQVGIEMRCPRGASCGPRSAWEFACPAPERFGGHLADLSVGETGEVRGGEVRAGGPRESFAFTASLTSEGHRARIAAPELRDAYATVIADFRFQIMPEELKQDDDQIQRLGVTDCDGLSAVLASACLRAGHEARVERGFMLGPFGLGHHSWVRVEDADGEWKVLDPALPMVAALGGSDVEAFSEFCCGSTLNRVVPCAAGHGRLAEHVCGRDRLLPGLVIRVRRDDTELAS